MPLDVELALFGDWPVGCPTPMGLPVRMVVAAGLAAVPGLAWWAEHALPTTTYLSDARVLLDVESPRLAFAVARLLGHREHDALARLWLRTYPEAALAGVFPVAIGPVGPARDAAERALRLLAGRGHRAKIDALAQSSGEAATAAVAEVFESARWDCPKKPPKLPPALRPEALPAPRVAGAPLSPDDVRTVLEMLRFSDVEPRYAGLDALRAHAEPRSLAELGWALASAWQTAGSKKSDEWMLFALAHLGDDEAIRRTTPALRASRVVELLATVATDAALIELATIAARGAQRSSGPFAAYGGLVDRARAAIADEARVRRVVPDALSESLVPTCRLDADGSVSLGYGSRSFRVGFDAHLSPFVLGEDGSTLATLPPARKDDDPALVAVAQERWRELREDVAAIATHVLASLDRAMVDGRTWARREWTARFVEHPLLRHVARRIVWERLDEAGRPLGTFRVAEDLTLADEHDVSFEPGDAERVRIAHPWRLGAETVDRWQRLAADYEVVEAIAQMSRARPDLRSVSEGAMAIRRAAPSDANAWARELAARGWVNAGWSFEHKGSTWWIALGEVAVLLVHVATSKEAELSFRSEPDEPAPVASIDPVWVAEAVRAAE
ncbi:MAG: DUF4132 domain-containing protein [Deltaproteobacteria bacterium]|nr:DUF4132 domain-containing protein [Deltaproteobacteria bacterium]